MVGKAFHVIVEFKIHVLYEVWLLAILDVMLPM